MTISLRLNDEDSLIIKKYAQLNGLSVSETLRRAIFEKIESEFDLRSYEESIAEYKKNPVTYTHEDVARMLSLE